MDAQLYELRYDTEEVLEFGDRMGKHEWVKCDQEDDYTPSRHRISKRVPRLRWQLLVKIRKLIKKGTILLDIDQNALAKSDVTGAGETPSIPAVPISSEFGEPDHLGSREHSIRLLSSIIAKDASTVSSNDDQNSDKQKQNVVRRLGNAFRNGFASKKRDQPSGDTDTLPVEAAKVFIAALHTEDAKPHLIFARFTEGHHFSIDNTPARFAAFLIGPATSSISYRELGRCLCDLLSNPAFQRVITRAKSPEALISGIDRILDHAIVIPPGQLHNVSTLDTRRLQRALTIDVVEPPRKHGHHSLSEKVMIDLAQMHTHSHAYDALRRTGKLFGGLLSDIKKRYRHYASDISDALHYKCLISTILIFFITFATAIGLAEILRSKTEGLMGLSETLVSMCVCGVVWGLVSGQPLIIQTKTAAFVMIEGGLFYFCYTHNVNFMVVRVWTGMWILLITILLVAFEAPVMIRYITRFTEETIDTLISVVLIFESLSFLIETFNDNPLLSVNEYYDFNRMGNATVDETTNMDSQRVGVGVRREKYGRGASGEVTENIGSLSGEALPSVVEFVGELHYQPNTAICTLVLMISTFFLSLYLERLKQSCYFSHTIRKAIGNFSIPITIPLMTVAANLLFKATYIHKLDMPNQFSPTRSHLRGWFINPFDPNVEQPFPTWAIFASIVPAFLLIILIFVELELAQRDLTVKERGMKKGSGFHMDLVLSGFLMLVCGLLGIPWLGPGRVESFSHANSLTIHTKAGIDGKRKVERVVEQRVTTVFVALLQGACAFFGQYLRRIPIAVLMGIFVHLGITNLLQIQFVHRIVLYIVPRKYYPDKIYCQQVSMWRMHLYTTIQLLCFAALLGVEVAAKIMSLFPMVLGMIALIRHFLLPKIFSEAELEALDSEGDLDDDEEVFAGTIRRKSANP